MASSPARLSNVSSRSSSDSDELGTYEAKSIDSDNNLGRVEPNTLTQFGINEASYSQSQAQEPQAIIATAPESVSSDSAASFSNSDSEDDEHALSRSVTRIKIAQKNNTSFESRHGFSTILSETAAPEKYPILELSQLMNQKSKMIDLNEILKQYMLKNKELDGEISGMVEEMKGKGIDRLDEEKKTPGMVRDVTSAKIEVLEASEKKVSIDTKVIVMKNSRVEKECKRHEFEIEALKLKIEAINGMIEEVEEEASQDKSDLDNLEPVKEELISSHNEMLSDNRVKMAELIRSRKRDLNEVVEEARNKPQNFKILLEQYRNEAIKEKANFVPEDLVQVRKYVEELRTAQKNTMEEEKQMYKSSEELSNRLFELSLEINLLDIKIKDMEEYNIHDNLRHVQELDKYPNKISALETTNQLLQRMLNEADEYLLMVLLKDMGKKERIDEELKAMGIMLDWSVVHRQAAGRHEEESSEGGASPRSRPSTSNASSRSTRGPGRFQRGSNRRGRGGTSFR